MQNDKIPQNDPVKTLFDSFDVFAAVPGGVGVGEVFRCHSLYRSWLEPTMRQRAESWIKLGHV
jgi:hypothetical protein